MLICWYVTVYKYGHTLFAVIEARSLARLIFFFSLCIKFMISNTQKNDIVIRYSRKEVKQNELGGDW